jgi:hypothetical protein
MVLYHRGAAIQPSVTREGNAFVARAVILEEDGEATSLGMLGQFASQNSAYEFALRSATEVAPTRINSCAAARLP